MCLGGIPSLLFGRNDLLFLLNSVPFIITAHPNKAIITIFFQKGFGMAYRDHMRVEETVESKANLIWSEYILIPHIASHL